MSIGALIECRLQEKELFPLRPKAAGAATKRKMYLACSIWDLLQREHDDDEFEERLGQLEADLELFVEGRPIDPKYLFLLYPARQAVWEIRSVRPTPSIRVLGLFASKDNFVVTNLALREDLGGWQSREWKEVKRSALAAWRRLFHPYAPLGASDIHNLVTGAIDGKYFK
jgi:hypothetical protein